MSLIPEEKVDEVRSATDLVELISRYVPLRRSGSTFKANCPFHQEKTPSFHVWPTTQTWKCFGCGMGGSCFHFLMEREGMDFPEAVRSLAAEAGIELPPERGGGPGGGPGPDASVRERLLEVSEWACRFFQGMLRADAGRIAVDYCRSRQITGETAQRFRIGFAPPGGRILLDAALEKGFSVDLLERAGLAGVSERGPYDWFRNRLLFPIQDVRGRVVAFGGRALDDAKAKYVNSPETALFKKGRLLYGLHLAKDAGMAKRRLALVEGYTDVLMAHQHGVEWVVAGLGTGLTRDNARLARRYADRIDLVYDADDAGDRAARRALDAFLEEDADVRVVRLPEGLDPCDYLVERGPEEFVAALDAGKEVQEYLIGDAIARLDDGTLAGRTRAVDAVLESVAKTQNPVRRDFLVKRVADAFELSEAVVRDRLKVFAGRGDTVETGAGFAMTDEDDPVERLAVEALLCRPELVGRLRDEWPPERFRHPVYREIAFAAVRIAGENGNFAYEDLVGRLPDPAVTARVTELRSAGSEKPDLDRQLDDCIRRMKHDLRLNETREALERARENGEPEEIHRLERELFRLRSRHR